MAKNLQDLDNIREGVDEASVRHELQQKLAIIAGDIKTKNRNKKLNFRAQRHQKLTSSKNLRSMLSDQLLNYFQKYSEVITN